MNEKDFIKLIKKSINEKKQDIHLSTKLKDIKKWDSLANVRVVLDLSRQFKKKIDMNKILNFITLKELYEFIRKK